MLACAVNISAGCLTVLFFRAAELMKDVENLRKHEADETAALENMVQQVEANLQTTLVSYILHYIYIINH